MIYLYFIKVLKVELFCISYGKIFQSLIVLNDYIILLVRIFLVWNYDFLYYVLYLYCIYRSFLFPKDLIDIREFCRGTF